MGVRGDADRRERSGILSQTRAYILFQGTYIGADAHGTSKAAYRIRRSTLLLKYVPYYQPTVSDVRAKQNAADVNTTARYIIMPALTSASR